MSHTPQYDRPLTTIQRALLIAAAAVMLGFGVLGAFGTYTNMTRVFGSAGTALGVIAAGEGITTSLALLTLILTAFSQSTPLLVRSGLWLMPLAAATVGVLTAPSWPLAAVQAVTPLGMCLSAEGLSLTMRRTVVYRTGVDPEQQRRTADVTRRLAYLRAVAERHPEENTRRKAELDAWKLAARAGEGDLILGADLGEIQRERLTVAADDALAAMFVSPAPTALALAPVPVIPAQALAEAPEVPESSDESSESSSDSAGHTVESGDDDEPVTPGTELAYAVTLLADAPPAWDGLSLREAVNRADSLVPGLTAPMLSAALRGVGIDTTAASIRSTRSVLRRLGKTDA